MSKFLTDSHILCPILSGLYDKYDLSHGPSKYIEAECLRAIMNIHTAYFFGHHYYDMDAQSDFTYIGHHHANITDDFIEAFSAIAQAYQHREIVTRYINNTFDTVIEQILHRLFIADRDNTLTPIVEV